MIKEELRFENSTVLEGMTSISALFAAKEAGLNDRGIERILFDRAKALASGQTGNIQALQFKTRFWNKLFLHMSFRANKQNVGVGMALPHNIGNCDGRIDMSTGTTASKNQIHKETSCNFVWFRCRDMLKTTPISPKFTASAVPP